MGTNKVKIAVVLLATLAGTQAWAFRRGRVWVNHQYRVPRRDSIRSRSLSSKPLVLPPTANDPQLNRPILALRNASDFVGRLEARFKVRWRSPNYRPDEDFQSTVSLDLGEVVPGQAIMVRVGDFQESPYFLTHIFSPLEIEELLASWTSPDHEGSLIVPAGNQYPYSNWPDFSVPALHLENTQFLEAGWLKLKFRDLYLLPL